MSYLELLMVVPLTLRWYPAKDVADLQTCGWKCLMDLV